MKKATREWLHRWTHASHDGPLATDALDSEKRLRAEVRRKNEALRDAMRQLQHAMTFVDVGDAHRTLTDALKPQRKKR